jgi:hypothetical protein
MTLKPGADGELPVGAFMGEARWQSQPMEGANGTTLKPKLPLSGSHETSL